MSYRPIWPRLDGSGYTKRRSLPLPGELDALLRWEAADIECSDMKAQTTVVGRFVYHIAPAAVTRMDFGGAGARKL